MLESFWSWIKQLYGTPSAESLALRELEMMILDHLKATGQLKPTPDEAHAQQNAIGLGSMLIDLIMVADNLGLDITSCLATAYLHRTGKAPK